MMCDVHDGFETKQSGRDDWPWANNAWASFQRHIMSWQAEQNRADWDQSTVKINSINESNMHCFGYKVTKYFIRLQGKEAIDKNQQRETHTL